MLASQTGAARASDGFSQEGIASYYSDSLAGRSTASGEPYRLQALTAAHRTLRFGTCIRVERMDNHEFIVVRVNDRGPFGGRGRIVDLSRAAAERIHMIRDGIVRVRIVTQSCSS